MQQKVCDGDDDVESIRDIKIMSLTRSAEINDVIREEWAPTARTSSSNHYLSRISGEKISYTQSIPHGEDWKIRLSLLLSNPDNSLR